MDNYSEEVKMGDGRSVILKRDGTWDFKNPEERLPTKRGWEDARLYILLGILGLVLLFVSDCLKLGSACIERYGKQFLANLFTEIGTALLVAVLLALTVQKVLKERDERRFRAERELIKRDVFEHVLGYRLPEGTFKELDNQILGAKFIRKDFKCCYELESISEFAKYVKVNATFEYEIVNRTPEELLFSFETAIEKAPVSELNDRVNFTKVIVTGCEPPIRLNDKEECEKEVDEITRPNHKVIKKPIRISGFEAAGVNVEFEVVRFLDGGGSFLLHPLQTVGFALKVEAPSDVEVSADPYFPGKLKKGREHYPDGGAYNWVSDHPILPYQGVYVTWKSKDNANLSSGDSSGLENNGSEKSVDGQN